MNVVERCPVAPGKFERGDVDESEVAFRWFEKIFGYGVGRARVTRPGS